MVLPGVINNAFQYTQDDENDRWRHKNIKWFETSTDPNDKNSKVYEIADGVDRRFSNSLVIIDRHELHAVVVRQHCQGDGGGKRKPVRVHRKKAQRDISSKNPKARVQVWDRLPA